MEAIKIQRARRANHMVASKIQCWKCNLKGEMQQGIIIYSTVWHGFLQQFCISWTQLWRGIQTVYSKPPVLFVSRTKPSKAVLPVSWVLGVNRARMCVCVCVCVCVHVCVCVAGRTISGAESKHRSGSNWPEATLNRTEQSQRLQPSYWMSPQLHWGSPEKSVWFVCACVCSGE